MAHEITIHRPSICKPRAVIFDWDNTLVDTNVGLHDFLNATLAKFGISLIDLNEFLTSHAALMSGEYLKTFFPLEIQEDALAFFRTYSSQHHLKFLQTIDKAQELMDACLQQNIPMGIVSNKRTQLLNAEIVTLGWQLYYGAVVGLGDTPYSKPHHGPLEHALNILKIAPAADVWFVGDSPYDYECSYALGCQPVMVGQLNHFSDRIDYTKAICVENLGVLKKMLLV